jgi:hypothetical protein
MTESTFTLVGETQYATPNANAEMDVVFVHGLGGDPTASWSSSSDPADFWPKWLAADFPNINVWTVGYDSGLFASALTGEGASLADRATMLLDYLASNAVGSRATIFITHSLGGLIVKQMLRRCSDSLNPNCKRLLAAAKGIVFIGTPHQGSNLASIVCGVLKIVLSRHVEQLAANDEILLDLGHWFQNWAASNQIAVAAYCEIRKTNGVKVVNKATADPNVLGCELISIDADHIALCKPATRESQLYKSVSAFLRDLLPADSMPLSRDAAITPKGTALISYIAASPPATQQHQLFMVPRGDTESQPSSLPVLFVAEPAESGLRLDPPALTHELLVDYQYFTTQAPDDRRPLAQKLANGGREHEVGDAERKKERFAMSLQRHSAQLSSLGRYVRLLSDVESRFNRHVAPSIADGAPAHQINRQVQDAVIDAALKAHMAETPDATASLVESALYYLTGNCHVRWDDNKV